MHPIPGCRGHPDFPNALEALLGVCEPQPSTWSERVLHSLWEDLHFPPDPCADYGRLPRYLTALWERGRGNNRFPQGYTQL